MASFALMPKAAFAALTIAGLTAEARAHHDARPSGELTANWPGANSPEAVHLVHGDYDWIRKGGYMGVDGTRCCGKDDCDQIPASRVERTPEGYTLRDYGLFVPFRQTQTSEDGKFWICRDAKAMRCFFAPRPGS
jgi:hypothetical protein